MQQKIRAILFSFLICICLLTFSGCSNAPAAPADSLISSSSEAETAATQPDTNSHDAVNLAIVLPGLDSANWQKIATAARNACKDAEEEFGCPINLIVQGPAGESDAEGYIACLENVIASEDLDGLIVAPLYPDPVVPIVAEASSMGIWVNLYAFTISGSEDNWHSIYLAGSYDAGVFAADAIKSSIDAENLDPSGKIALFMSVINTSGEEMFQGLYDRLSEVLPTAEVLEIQYNENDIDKGIGQIEATLATYGDEISGIFAGNNTTGTALARAISEGGFGDRVAAVAIDADTDEVEAVIDGSLDALIMRPDYWTVYNMMFDTIDSILNGTEYDKYIYCEYSTVTKEEIDSGNELLTADLYPETMVRD